uniref:RNase H type-1 domain-containing protein n=1 Tax=Cannabis sativa TaxID=3483 RepID=A0A803QEN3_CANSA
MLLQQDNRLVNEVSTTKFWKHLWALKVPPKVKNMIWRTGTDFLPTMCQLFTKRVVCRNAQKSQIETSWPGLEVSDGAEQWTCPPVNSVKINVDSALFEDGSWSGVGIVTRDDKGLLLEEFIKVAFGWEE